MSENDFIYSILADDEDLREIVEMFVEEMPERVDLIRKELQAQDWDSLERTVHQLKGAAGSYGFAGLSPAAGNVETLIRDKAPFEEISAEIDKLIHLCSLITAKAPQ